MWIVRLALRRPYTFVVVALLIVVLGVVTHRAHADRHLSRDRHPGRQRHLAATPGLPPDEMEAPRHHHYERVLTTTVNDIEHIESQSLHGRRRHQDLLPAGREDRAAAVAQVTAISQTLLRTMPPGHHAAAHPPLQRLERADPAARLGSDTLTRAAALRLRHELHPHRSSPPCRARGSPARTAASRGRSWSTSTRRRCTREGCRRRRRERGERPEPASCRPARRRSATGVSGPAQQQPGRRRRAQRPADQERERQRRSTCATSPTCATASPPDQHRRHATVSAACSCRSSRARRRLDARHRAAACGGAAGDPGHPAAGA